MTVNKYFQLFILYLWTVIIKHDAFLLLNELQNILETICNVTEDDFSTLFLFSLIIFSWKY